MWSDRARRAGVLAVYILLAGCGNKATGQVAAVVNGEEITLLEINGELEGVQVPQGADEKQVRSQALQRIIDRRLLARAARDEGIDKTPQFLIRSRQLEDALLVQLMAQKTGRTTAVPEAKAVDDYISSNPARFEGRTVFTIDRIQFPMPADANVLKQLEDDHSMEAIAAQLRQLGIQFTRGPAQMDSARIGKSVLDQIRALPDGEPFILPESGVVTVGVITASIAQPVDLEQAKPVAAQAMRNQALADALKRRLDAEKAKADIEYQEGFAPVAPSASPAAKSSSG